MNWFKDHGPTLVIGLAWLGGALYFAVLKGDGATAYGCLLAFLSAVGVKSLYQPTVVVPKE